MKVATCESGRGIVLFLMFDRFGPRFYSFPESAPGRFGLRLVSVLVSTRFEPSSSVDRSWKHECVRVCDVQPALIWQVA